MQERAALIKRRHEDTRARPVDTNVANGKSMESKLIWQYLTSNLPLHCRRTLDQFGYPSLRNTAVRDADQVLYKRTRINKDSPSLQRETAMQHLKHIGRSVGRQASVTGAQEDVVAKVLMVDQLWLWVLDGGEFHLSLALNHYAKLSCRFRLYFVQQLIDRRNCSHLCSSEIERRE